jgi:hypothetical protein
MPNTIRLHRVMATKPEKIYRAFLEADAMAKTIDSAAAIVLEISDGKIRRFLMIEDSFDVSCKARS